MLFSRGSDSYLATGMSYVYRVNIYSLSSNHLECYNNNRPLNMEEYIWTLALVFIIISKTIQGTLTIIVTSLIVSIILYAIFYLVRIIWKN